MCANQRILLTKFEDPSCNENVLVKCEFALLESLRDCSKPFNATKAWQILKKEASMNGAQFRGPGYPRRRDDPACYWPFSH